MISGTGEADEFYARRCMDVVRDEIVALIDKKIDDIIERPSAYGGKQPLEPLILVLLMIRQRTRDSEIVEAEIVQDFLAHVNKRLGFSPEPLSDRFPETYDGEAEEAALIREYVNALRSDEHLRRLDLEEERKALVKSRFERPGMSRVGQPGYRERLLPVERSAG